MKWVFPVLGVLLLACPAEAADPPPPKPKLKVSADGFPAGHASPEAAACDLARAFITEDAALFTTTCLPAYGGEAVRNEYKDFLHGVVESLMKTRALKLDPASDGPKAIAKVFAARHLSRGGQASYGYAAFGFQDVMFVDVDALLNNGEHAVNRTLVIQTKDGQWFVHPAPQVSPLLSEGLDDEGVSTRDLAEVYEVEH